MRWDIISTGGNIVICTLYHVLGTINNNTLRFTRYVKQFVVINYFNYEMYCKQLQKSPLMTEFEQSNPSKHAAIIALYKAEVQL